MTPDRAKLAAWTLIILGAVLIVVPLRSMDLGVVPIVLSLVGAGLLWLGKTLRDVIAEAEYERDVRG